MAGQGGRRSEPDIGVASWNRRCRKPCSCRGLVTLTPAAAEERGPLLVLALSHPWPAGPAPPPFLWPSGAGEGWGWRRGWRAKWDPGALLPGHGHLPQQCWWESKDMQTFISARLKERCNVSVNTLSFQYTHRVVNLICLPTCCKIICLNCSTMMNVDHYCVYINGLQWCYTQGILLFHRTGVVFYYRHLFSSKI